MQSCKTCNFTLSISLLMRRHSSERSMKRCWKWKRTVYARQAGALWKANACLLKKRYLLMIYSHALHQSSPGGLSSFFADCSRIVEKVKLGVRSSRSLGKPESEQVCSGRCVKYGAISHPMAAHFLYFQTISQSRRPCTE